MMIAQWLYIDSESLITLGGSLLESLNQDNWIGFLRVTQKIAEGPGGIR